MGKHLDLRSKDLSLFLNQHALPVRLPSTLCTQNGLLLLLVTPRDVMAQDLNAPTLQKGRKTHSHGVGLGAGEMEGPGELGGIAQKGFPEEASVGISKQLKTLFKINIVYLSAFSPPEL